MIPFLKDDLFAISQLRDPRLWKPVLWATLLSLGSIFFTVLIAGTLIFQTVDSLSQSLTYWMSWADGWIAGIATVLGTFFIAMLGYFFLVNVYAAILGIFIDGALDDVHDTHFPNTTGINHQELLNLFFHPFVSYCGAYLSICLLLPFYWSDIFCHRLV